MMFRLASVTILTMAVAACSSPPKAPEAAPAPAPVVAAPAPVATPAPAPAPAAPQAAPESKVTPVTLAPHLDPANALSKDRSVFFDFDQFVIREPDRRVVELHGKYLASANAVKVVVEGNADERGSREYNLALGNKRAQAVVQSLKLLGAKDGQMEAVSYGEERPRASGHDEASWAQNRRADIVYR
jgi:peptidoglycan-associated lipoprotein